MRAAGNSAWMQKNTGWQVQIDQSLQIHKCDSQRSTQRLDRNLEFDGSIHQEPGGGLQSPVGR